MGFRICAKFNFALFIEVQSCPCHDCAGKEGRFYTTDNMQPIDTEDEIRDHF